VRFDISSDVTAVAVSYSLRFDVVFNESCQCMKQEQLRVSFEPHFRFDVNN